jgi:hypothetical protein
MNAPVQVIERDGKPEWAVLPYDGCLICCGHKESFIPACCKAQVPFP